MNKGYALIAAIIAINVLAVLALISRPILDTIITRELELELIFRARQYVRAISWYQQENNNLFPGSLNELYEKKYLRKLFKDPLSEDGEWLLVMKKITPGDESLLVVPQALLAKYIDQANIIGVCSNARGASFRIYREKKKYNEWAFYVGEDPKEEMPSLIFVKE